VRTASVVDVPSLTIRLDEAVRLIDELPWSRLPSARSAAARGASARPRRCASGRHPSSGVALGAGRAAPASAHVDPSAERLARTRCAAPGTHFSTPFFGELRQAVRVTSIEHPEAML
jgi:uroporphyrin-3 C-methyltransferase